MTALALFIPIIGGTGGNVGVQASAIVVQGLANGSLDIKHFASQLGKEVLSRASQRHRNHGGRACIQPADDAHRPCRDTLGGGIAVRGGDVRVAVGHRRAP